MDSIIEALPHEYEILAMLNDWLPKKVIDAHVHAWPNHGHSSIMNPFASSPGLTFNYFPWDLHSAFIEHAFPKIDYCMVCMGHPGHLLDEKDNEYLLCEAKEDERISPVMLAITDKSPLRITKGAKNGFRGIKMYPSYAQKKSLTEISEVWPLPILELSEKLGLPLIMHLPNGLPGNSQELARLAKSYPFAKLIAAHMGVSYCHYPSYKKLLKLIKPHKNIYLDTAMVSDCNVIGEALQILGAKRVLFASDAPFSYLRGGYTRNKRCEVRFHVREKYPWVNDDEYRSYQNQTNDLMFAHINIMLAIKQALKMIGLEDNQEIKERIFCKNAETLF